MKGNRPTLICLLVIGLLAGSVAGVPGKDERDDPVPFTARFVPSSQVRAGTTEMVGDHVEERGHA